MRNIRHFWPRLDAAGQPRLRDEASADGGQRGEGVFGPQGAVFQGGGKAAKRTRMQVRASGVHRGELHVF